MYNLNKYKNHLKILLLLFVFVFFSHILSLLLGAHLMMLSTLKIISAASEAEIKACSLHLKLSCLLLITKKNMYFYHRNGLIPKEVKYLKKTLTVTPSFCMSAISPFIISKPAEVNPSAISTLSACTRSGAS